MTAVLQDCASQEASEQVDLGLLVTRLWRGRVVIFASALVVAGLFAAIGFWMTPIYVASTVIVPATTSRLGASSAMPGSLASLASLAGVDVSGAGGAQVQEALAVLRSRAFNEEFIAEHDLLPKFFAKKWDSGKQRWNVPAERQPTLFQAFEYFSKLRTIDENKKTGLVTVQIEWRDPQETAQWANSLVARLNEVMRNRALERTNAYLSHLQQELENTAAVDTRAAINRLVEAQINERMLANVTKEYAFRVVDTALAPDASEPVRPKKLVLTLVGAGLGSLVGATFVLLGVMPRRRLGD